MCTQLGIGAIDAHHPVLDTLKFWHGMIDAVSNTVNVPSTDPMLDMMVEYKRGEHIRGSRNFKPTRGKDCKPNRIFIHS